MSHKKPPDLQAVGYMPKSMPVLQGGLICRIVNYKSQLNSKNLPTTGHCPPDLTFFPRAIPLSPVSAWAPS